MRLSIHSTEKPDEELVALYKHTGNVQHLGQLYERYTALVYGVCLKYLKNKDEAQDSVMNLFEELCHKLLQHEVRHFGPWLHTLCRNHCLMLLRAQGRHREVSIEEHHMESEPARHLYTNTATTREHHLLALEDCVERLPTAQRHTIRLFYMQQQSYKDISESEQLEINQVKSHIQNGKRNLKICLESKGISGIGY